ncbi:hypothetical protein JCM1840_000986 [Sporobolomyces johnsonii]
MSASSGSIHDADQEKAGLDPTQQEKPAAITTLQEDVAAVGLDKVYERHGRIDLVPLPSDLDQDPLNWPSWRKHALLVQVAFHSMMGPFSAAATIPSFESFVEDFGISITQASYTVSIVIVFLGVFPLVWGPVSARIGRRPILLASALIAGAMHVASAYCNSYGALMTTRVFSAIFICPPQSIGASMVNEMFFQHEKGEKLGIWTLLTSLGPPVAPLIMGPVVYHTGTWRWTFWLLAIINLVQFILYIFLAPETLFDRPVRGEPDSVAPLAQPVEQKDSWWSPYITFKRRSNAPWSQLPKEIIRPIGIALAPTVMLPTLAYAIAFAYSNVLLTVEIPSLLGRKYNLNAQGVGLQFVGAVVGAALGELIAGRGSDMFIAWRTRRAGGNREPEMRLPLALPGYLLCAVGIIVFGVQLQNTEAGHWNVTPIVGVAIAIFGLQLVTTVSYAYVVESMPPDLAPRVPAFVALFRQIYAFTAPFYLNLIFEQLGDAKASGLLAALVGGFGFICITACLVLGAKWRAAEVAHAPAFN